MRKRPSLWLLCSLPWVLALVHCSMGFEDEYAGSDSDSGSGGNGPPPIDDVDATTDAGPAPRGLVAIQVVAGDRHSCAVNATGSVYCWGDNDRGQLGLPLDIATVSVPRRVELPEGVRAVRLAAGGSHTCALTDRKDLVCWGRNDRGQVARPAAATALPDRAIVPSALSTAAFVAISAGQNHTCALYVQPQVGDAGDPDAAVADEVLRLACWGDNAQAQLARDDAPFVELPADIRRGPGGTSGPAVVARFVALGGDFSVASARVGEAYRVQAWGDSTGGGTTTDPDGGPRSSPATVERVEGGPIDGVVQLQAGARHACAAVLVAPSVLDGGESDDAAAEPDPDAAEPVPEDAGDSDAGTTRVQSVVCWGSNDHGQLARGAAGARELAAPAVDDTGLGGELVLGGATTCLLDAGILRCAGANDRGQLGVGQADDLAHPAFALVTGFEGRVQSAALGARHGCALVDVGASRSQVACWGDNTYGQLGDAIPLGAGYAEAGAEDRYRRARPAFVAPAE